MIEEQLQQEQQPEPEPKKLSVKDFAAKIKQQYPTYNDVEDGALVQRIIEKYPVYKDKVDFNIQPTPTPEPVPTPTPEPTPTAEPTPAPTPQPAPEPINPIKLAAENNKLKNQGSFFSSGNTVADAMVGDQGAFVQDESAKKKQEENRSAIKSFVENPDDLENEFSDFPESWLSNPSYTPEKLFETRMKNPLLYSRQLAAIKWHDKVLRRVGGMVENGEISEQEGRQLSEIIWSGNTEKDHGKRRANTQLVANFIREHISSDEQPKYFEYLKTDRSVFYRNPEVTKGDSRRAFLDEDELLALQYTEDTNPEKAQQYYSVLVDTKKVENNKLAQDGITERKYNLKKLGISLQIAPIQEEMADIISRQNDVTGEFASPEDEKKYNDYAIKLENLNAKMREVDVKYPTVAQNDMQSFVKELIGSDANPVALIPARIGLETESALGSIQSLAYSVFANDESNKIYQNELLGQSAQTERVFGRPQSDLALQTFKPQLSEKIKGKVDAIVNNGALSYWEKDKQISQILKENPGEWGRIPIEGGKLNLRPSAIIYSVGDLVSSLVPFMAAEAATAGGATAGVVRKLTSTFMSAGVTTLNHEYDAALRKGDPRPMATALVNTAIISAAMTGAGTAEKVKAIFGNKTAVGELVSKMDDKAIDAVLKSPRIEAAKQYFKAIPKATFDAAKKGVEFEGFMAGGDVVKAAVNGEQIHPEERAKQGFVAVISFAGMGLGRSAISVDRIVNANPIQFDALMRAAKTPEIFKEVAADMVANGDLSANEYSQITRNIDKVAQVVSKTKFIDNNGQPLSEDATKKLLALKVRENEISEEVKGDVPEKFKEAKEAELQQVKSDQEKIYAGQEVKLSEEPKGEKTEEVSTSTNAYGGTDRSVTGVVQGEVKASEKQGDTGELPKDAGTAGEGAAKGAAPVLEGAGNNKEADGFDFSQLFTGKNEKTEQQANADRQKEIEIEREASYQKSSFDKRWAKTYKEAKQKLVEQYNKAKVEKEKWEAKRYKSAGGKTVDVGDELSGGTFDVDGINKKRKDNAIKNAQSEMDSALIDLEQLGLTKDEISNLIEPSPELQKTTEPSTQNPALKDVESKAKKQLTDNELESVVGRDVFKAVQRAESQLGEGIVDRNRMIETAKRIQRADKKDKLLPEHIFEALQYETGFPDNWQDLRNAIKNGGIDINSEAIQRQIEVGVDLPKDIVEEFRKSERYKKATPELKQAVEELLAPTKEAGSVGVGGGEVDFTAKGGNKIVDEKGEPLTVFHGSEHEFTEFKPKSLGTYGEHAYYYFAKAKSWVEKFAKEEPVNKDKFKIKKFNLSIKNPLDIRDQVLTVDEWIKYFESKGVALSDKTKADWQRRSGGNKRETYPAWVIFRNDNGVFKKEVQDAGYDGIIMHDKGRGKMDNTVYVAFDNNQIKSAEAAKAKQPKVEAAEQKLGEPKSEQKKPAEKPKESKPEVKKEPTRQEKINALLDLADRHNSTSGVKKSEKAKLLNEIRAKSQELGLKADYSSRGGHVTIKSEAGNKVQRRSLDAGKKEAKNFDRTQYSTEANEFLDAGIENPETISSLYIQGPDGKRMTVKQIETALQSIKEGKPNNNAVAVMEALQKMAESGEVDMIDPVSMQRENKFQPPTPKEWVESFKQPTELTPEKEEVAKQEISNELAEKIVNDEGITLDNLQEMERLFEGSPYDKTDLEAVKQYLNERQSIRKSEGEGQEGAGNAETGTTRGEGKGMEEGKEQTADGSTEAEIKRLEDAHEAAKRELYLAESEIANKDVAQGNLALDEKLAAENVQQGALFSARGENAKDVLDPLRQKVRETKAALEEARSKVKPEKDEAQQELFEKVNEVVDEKAVKDATQKSGIKLPDWLVKGFTSNRGLPKMWMVIKDLAIGERKIGVKQIKQSLSKLETAVRKTGFKDTDAISKALQDKNSPEFLSLPQQVQDAVKNMRLVIDGYSESLVNNGYVTPSQATIISENIGQYLNRSYRLFTEKDWAKKVDAQVKKDAINFLAQQKLAEIQADPNKQNLTQSEMIDLAVKLATQQAEDILTLKKTPGGQRYTEQFSKDLSPLKRREDIPEPVRKLMGEYTDPAIQFAITVSKLATLHSQAKMLNDLKAQFKGVLFFEKDDVRPEGFNYEVASSDSDTWNPLSGLYTNKLVIDVLQENAQNIEAWHVIYQKVFGTVKKFKTVYSLPTQTVNFFANPLISLSNGHFDLSKIGKSFKFIKDEMFNDGLGVDDVIDTLIERNVLGQSVDLRMLRSMLQKDKADEFALEEFMKPKKSMLNPMQWAKGTDKYLQKLYGASDSFWKVYGYMNEASGLSKAWYGKEYKSLDPAQKKAIIDEATERIKNTYPTYDRALPALMWAGKNIPFIGNFMAFQAEVIRTIKNNVSYAVRDLRSDNPEMKKLGAKRMAGIISYLSVKQGINYMIGAAAGQAVSSLWASAFGSDDEETKRKSLDKFLPEFLQTHNLYIESKGNGVYSVYDIDRLDPYNAAWQAINGLEVGDNGGFKRMIQEAVRPFIEPDMLARAAYDISQNKDFKGAPIYNEADNPYSKGMDAMMYLWNVVEPTTLKYGRRVIKDDSPGTEAVTSLFGARSYDIDVKKVFKGRIKTAGSQLSSNSYFNYRDKYGADQIKIKDNLKRIIAELHDNYNAAIKLGASDDELDEIINSGFKMTKGARDIKSAIKSGEISDSELDDIYNK